MATKKIEKQNSVQFIDDDKKNQNNLENKKNISTEKNLAPNSIDNQAKKFAEFFNGEVINLE